MLISVMRYLAMLPSALVMMLLIAKTSALRRPRLYVILLMMSSFAFRIAGDLWHTDPSALVSIPSTALVVVLAVVWAPKGKRVWALSPSCF